MDMKAYVESIPEFKNNIKLDIVILDYEIQDELFVYEIYNSDVDLILFSTYLWNISRALEITRKLKIVKNDLIIGLGGPEVEDAKKILTENQQLDLISIGEGEKTLELIIRKFLVKEDIDLHGVIYRSGEEIKDTGNPLLIENLDEIPSIVNDKIIDQYDMLLYETSRGCPFQCKYCCWAGKKMRYFSLDRVEKDLKILLEKENGNSLFIIDSELDINIDRAKEIMKIIIRYNKYNKTIQGFLGLHQIDENLLELCRNAKFKFGIGIQTVNEIALKECGRSWFNVEKFENKILSIKKFYDIKNIELQLIMGLPGDNYEFFKKNLMWCDKIGGENITANRLYLLPGSYFYKNAQNYSIKYDEKPYHLIYSNYSYSYDDLMKSEAYLAAFQTLHPLFGKYKKISFEDKILDMWIFIEEYSKTIEKQKMYCQGRQESQSKEYEYDFNKAILITLEKLKLNSQAFKNFLEMRITLKKASYHFGCERIENKKNDYVYINSYFKCPFVRINNFNSITEYDQNTVFYFHNFIENKIIKFVVSNKNEKIINQYLEELLKGKDINEFKKSGNDNLIYNSLVQKLINEKIILGDMIKYEK